MHLELDELILIQIKVRSPCYKRDTSVSVYKLGENLSIISLLALSASATTNFQRNPTNMKAFVALCIFAFVAAAQGAGLTTEQVNKLKDNYKHCIESSHVDSGLVAKARKGEFDENSAPLDEFFTCMFKRSDFIDDEGHLKLDVIKSKVPSDISKENVDKVFTACTGVQKEPKEKIARLAYKCYLTKTPVKIQLIADAA